MKVPTLAGGVLLAALALMAVPFTTTAQEKPAEAKPSEGEAKPAETEAKPARPATPIGPRPSAMEVKGKLVLPDGTPAVGATIAQQFDLSSGSPKVARGTPLTTDEEGNFSGTINAVGDFSLVAYTADGKHAGWTFTNRAGVESGVDITLAPVVEISGSLQFPLEDDKTMPVSAYSVVLNHTFTNAMGRVQRVPVIAMSVTDGKAFTANVPVGSYLMVADPARNAPLPAGMWTYDLQSNSRRIEAKADEPIKLGDMKLQLTRLGSLKGKTFPEWKVSEAKNTDGKNQIADYKGKWILVEFWGHW